MNVPTVERLRSQVLEEIRTFQWNLSRLAALDYSNPAPGQLIDEIREEIEIERQTLKSLDSFPGKTELVLKLLRNCHRKIAARIPFLGYLERAQTQHVPWSLIESVQVLAGAIIPGYRIIIASVDAHNYLVEWDPETKRLFLWLPRLHRLNVLWHTNIGHELFHPALKTFFDEQLPKVAPSITEACKKLLANDEEPLDESDLFAQGRIDVIVRETLELWRRGLSEILCDLGCATIFGPAAIMALLSMAQCDDLDTCPEPPQYYPPWRFRFRVVHSRVGDSVQEFIEQQQGTTSTLTKYFNAFSQALDSFNRITTGNQDKAQIDAHPLSRIAYKCIEESVDAGWDYVQNLVPSKVKRWKETQDQVPALLRRLQAGIPPSEVDQSDRQLSPQAADLSAILVAGWVYESFWQTEDIAKRKFDYSTLMRLILKGCEDAALRREYQNNKQGSTQ